MSLSAKILQIWSTSLYTAPTVPLIYNDNEYLATVEDSDIFLRFMSADGQIFLALNNKCQLVKPPPTIGNNVYVCTKVDAISCSPTSGPQTARDLFVLNKIAPLLV